MVKALQGEQGKMAENYCLCLCSRVLYLYMDIVSESHAKSSAEHNYRSSTLTADSQRLCLRLMVSPFPSDMQFPRGQST